MPIEDPRRDGSRRNGLRIGGWLETFPARRALPGRPPLVTPPPPRVPVFHPARPRESGRRPLALPALAQVEDPRQVRLRVALTCLVALAVGGTTFAVLADRAGSAPDVAQVAVADPVTLGPMPMPTTVPTSASPSASASPSPSHTSSAPPRKALAPVHHKSSQPSVIGGLRVGGTISLASWGRFRSAFVVHAAGTCVTLESVRFRDYFLVARDNAVTLERSAGSAFCPVAAGEGGVHLRSAARPGDYLVSFRSRLFLAPVPASRAAVFAPS
jgi:hypothetical protein